MGSEGGEKIDVCESVICVCVCVCVCVSAHIVSTDTYSGFHMCSM